MTKPATVILHYSSPPTVGGVEAAILAHAREFAAAGYPVTVVSGRGSQDGLPEGAGFDPIPLMHSQHPEILAVSRELENGVVSTEFDRLVAELERQLEPVLAPFDAVIMHNLFSKHFNLPLTAALNNLISRGVIKRPIQWIHDLSWTSQHSLGQMHEGYPWDLLRTMQPRSIYITISEARRNEIVSLFGCSPSAIKIIYDGVAPEDILGLSPTGSRLIRDLGVWSADLVLLMPVRVTQAKNIEYAIRLAAALKEADIQPRIILTGPPDPHDPEVWQYYQSLLDLRRQLGVEQEFRFVYEMGGPDSPMIIGQDLVGELYRVADFLFMPSHREGFGMPVIEAGLVGIPVLSTPVPAAVEIGGKDVLIFSTNNTPESLADQILIWIEENPTVQMRRRVRLGFLWESIFRREILPLITGER